MDFCESVNDVWISFLDKIEPITRIWGALTSVGKLSIVIFNVKLRLTENKPKQAHLNFVL